MYIILFINIHIYFSPPVPAPRKCPPSHPLLPPPPAPASSTAVIWQPPRSPSESTPRRRRNPLEDHLRTTALCTRCSSLHHRMRRARRPGSWWCELTKGIVLYGPRAIAPLLQQEEEEFQAKEGIAKGNTTETKTLRKKRETKTEGRHSEVTVLVSPSVTILREAQRRGVHTTKVFNFQKVDRDHRQGRRSGRQFKDRQTLTERTGAFKDRTIREEDETHLESN